MALLNAALPKSSFTFAHPLTFSKERNNLLTKKFRVPSHGIRGSSFAATCSSEDVVRSDFPPSFMFGASSSALQTEGYATEGGRGPGTWDHMLGRLPAAHSLVKYKEDVKCLKNMNANGYRFSFSWSRILPTGKITGGINQEGVDFYNNLINELIDNGITPFVTLFHFDMPSALQKEYNGLLSSQFVYDFNNYADLCFQLFGDRVKFWATFNEPSVYCENGYQFEMSGEDDKAIYPYIAAHHLLLAHAAAVKTYRNNYKKHQHGKMGISLVTTWCLPCSNSPSDVASAHRLWDFIVGWYLDPLVTGDYPFSMKTIVRDRLPQFSPQEQEMLKGSYDFIGINYYTSRYTRGLPFSPNDVPVSYEKDKYVEMLTENENGIPVGPKCDGMDFMYVYPEGLAPILVNLKTRYEDPLIYITENGYAQLKEGKPKEEVCEDDVRIDYMKAHLRSIRTALREEVNVDGYFVWTLMDNMEVFDYFYKVGFGLHYVDIPNDFERIPKKSANWFKDFLAPVIQKPKVQEPQLQQVNERVYA